ncbi:MAG: CBS domain-containing protein [Ardenticatenia bacterium]|nr:MAG: CBS domain-containing protein [Ardenticatenia bacterium]
MSKVPQTVREIMTPDPITVTPDATLAAALQLMIEHGIRRLPVVTERGELVGIISDRDLRLAADSPLLQVMPEDVRRHFEEHRVSEIMRTVLITIEADEPIVEAAKLMRVARVGGLPVVERNGALVGILTRSDLIDHLIRLLEPVETSA